MICTFGDTTMYSSSCDRAVFLLPVPGLIDHGPEFWHLLGKIMPDYDDRRRELRGVGGRFEW